MPAAWACGSPWRGQAGATADEDFPGLAALVGPDGSLAARLPDWRPGVLTVDIPC